MRNAACRGVHWRIRPVSGPSYLAEIDTGKKPGSAEALRKLSGVLAIPMENLVSRPG